MKYFLITFLCLFFSFSSFADEKNGEKAELFQKIKEEHLKMLDERIANLQKNRACVAEANNHEGMKQCRASMKEFREHMKAEMAGRKEARKERHKKWKEKHKQNSAEFADESEE